MKYGNLDGHHQAHFFMQFMAADFHTPWYIRFGAFLRNLFAPARPQEEYGRIYPGMQTYKIGTGYHE